MVLSYEFNFFKDIEIMIFDIILGEMGNFDFVILELEIIYLFGI